MKPGGVPQNSQINWNDSEEKTLLHPLRLLILLVSAVVISDGFIMYLFHLLPWLAGGNPAIEILLNASLLTAIVFPLLYFFHYKPLNTFVARLSVEEKRYHNLIEFSPDAILAHSRGKVIFANPATLKAVGMASQDEVVGRTFMDMVHPDYHEAVRERIEMIERDGAVAPLMEGKILRRDGTEVEMEWASAPMLCEDRYAILTVARDITERKKAEKKLADTQLQLAQARKLASIGRLSAGLAHEIKNPLYIISLSAQTLMMEENIETETKETLKTVLEQTNRASTIIDKLKIFAEGRAVEPVVFDLREHLTGVEKSIREEIAARGIALTVDLPEGPIMLRGDGEQLCEVCQGLLSNARDSVLERMESSAKGGFEQKGWKPAITIRARVSEGKAIISVEDTGTGIRGTDMEKIFDPFFSTKPEGEGAGLGLSTALGVVESHGGTLGMESAFGKGSVFTVTLPLAEEN